ARAGTRVAGVTMNLRSAKGLAWGFVAFLIFHGATPYLGLRTTGNFTMFSNLATENWRSNHLLVPSGQLFGYQQDIVWIRSIDRRVRHWYKRKDMHESLEGMGLPAVEFRKLVGKWSSQEDMQKLHAELTYEGQDLVSSDLAKDLRWGTQRGDWASRF